VLKFRQEERKQLQSMFYSIDQHLKDTCHSLKKEMYPESIEKSLQQLNVLFEKRHQMIMAEIERYITKKENQNFII